MRGLGVSYQLMLSRVLTLPDIFTSLQKQNSQKKADVTNKGNATVTRSNSGYFQVITFSKEEQMHFKTVVWEKMAKII